MTHVWSRKRRTLTARRAALLVPVFCGVVLIPGTAPAVASTGIGSSVVASVSDGSDSPFAQARESGEQVEILAGRTEYNTSFADPEGTTTVRMSIVPVRVRQGSGWAEVDPALVARADGMIAPKASVIDVAFSGGGDGPLATFRRGDDVLHIEAPMPLTEPVVEGPSATYPEVLPGVDLVVTATGDGFGEVLVVKNASAAANPALRTLRFGLAGRGLEMQETTGGGLAVRDSSGAEVLSAGQPTMWDSSSASGSTADAGAETSVAGPVEGDRQAPIQIEASAEAMTLTPDAVLLTAPGTTYPVYIDPATVAKRTEWGMVDEAHPKTSYYLWGSGDGDATEGMGYSADGDHTKRLFYGFNTAAMRTSGRVINSATLRMHETWAYSCITIGLQAWLTTGIGSGTTWDEQPEWTGPRTARSVPTSGRPDCQPSGSEIDFDVKDQVVQSVANNWTMTTIGVKASSEDSVHSWRRFTKVATLEVVYNSRPNVPAGPQMVSPPTKCGGYVPRGDLPILQVRASDVDIKKVSGVQVRVQFEWFKNGSKTPLDDPITQPKASGSKFTHQLLGLADGKYTWQARTYDGQLSSDWTDPCAFTVDGTAPTPPNPPQYVSGTFAVGQKVTFAFSGGGAGVVSYKWAVNADVPTSPAIAVASAGAVPVPVTRFGPFILRVWAYDGAGNESAVAIGDDEILATGADAKDWWRMDDSGATVAANEKTVTNPLALSGGASRVAGFPLITGHALALDATSTAVAQGAPGPADGQNFSVSAWGRLSTIATRQVLISQDVGTNSGFTVAVENIAGPKGEDEVAGRVLPRFTATLHTSTGATALKVVSRRALQEDEWAHAAVQMQYLESGAQELVLYTTVDGEPDLIEDSVVSTDSTPASATSTAATSYIRVGAERKNSVVSNRWNGAIDEVVTARGIFDEAQRVQWRIQ